MSGIGVSILYVGSAIAIERAFVGKAKGVALAIHQLCTGLGCLGYPFLLDILLKTYQVNGTLLLLGGINLNNIAVGLVIYIANKHAVDEEPIDKQPGEIKEGIGSDKYDSWLSKVIDYLKTILSFMLTFRLGVIVIATSLSVAVLNGFLVIVLDMFASKGFTAKQGLDSFTVFNSGHVLGKIFTTVAQFKSTMNPVIVCLVSCVCGCVGQVFIEVFSNMYLVYVGSGLSGMSIGQLYRGPCWLF